MSHSHPSAPLPERRLGMALGLLLAYLVIEVLGGLWTGSLALLSDAGHMASDVAALALALLAARLARRSPTPRQTYGFHRAEVLAALVNATALVAVATSVFWEAAQRLAAPPEVRGDAMLAIAVGGLLVNGAALALLHIGKHDASLNVRAAILHLLGDTLGSLGAIASGVAIVGWGARWADPVASLGIGLLLVVSALRLLREVVHILMEGMPRHLEPHRIQEALGSVPGVRSFHDLHVWTLSTGREVLSCHLVLDGSRPAQEVLDTTRKALEPLGLHHVTLQTEEADCGSDCACSDATP